jgi:GTP-binding protein HflX
VNGVLEEIGASQIPQILVYNKIDRLQSPPRIDRDADGRAVAVWISAEEGTGLDLLKQAVAERLSRFARHARLRVPASAGALRSRLYAAHAVRSESTSDDGSIELAVELPDPELLTLARTAGVQILEVQGAGTPCAPGSAYLQSPAASSAGKRR